MNNKKLIGTILLAVAGISAISLVTLYDIDPRWALLQGLSITTGVCILATIRILGWPRILAFAPAGYLAVCILCIACFFCPAFEGAHRGLSFAGKRIFHPSFFVPLAVACLMVWHELHKSRTSVVLITALVPAIIVLLMPYASIFTMISALVCILAYSVLSARPNTGIKKIVASLSVISIIFYLSPVLYGRRRLIDFTSSGWARIVRRQLIEELGKCSWFGYGNGDCTVYTFSPIWGNPHVHCAYVMGLWAIIAVLLLFTVLGVCFFLAYRRAEPGPRRTLILGCSIVLLISPFFSFTRLCFAVPGHNYLMPFLSQGGSTALASFTALGLILAALRKDPKDLHTPHANTRIITLNVLLALIIGLALTIGLTKHPGKPILWFMQPNYWQNLPKPPPPPIRGRILADDDTVLAFTTNHWTIRLDPQSPMGNTNVWTKTRIAKALSKELDLPYTNLITHLNNPKNRYIMLKETDDGQLIEHLKTNAVNWRLVLEKYQGRVYPLGESAAHYVGASTYKDTWSRTPTKGMFGIEYTRNDDLIEGNDVRIPMIPSMQTNLWSLVNRLRAECKANAAWAIALTATNKTPRILAMTKCPSYDPTNFGSFREQQWENAPARFEFDLTGIWPYLIPPGLTNDQNRLTKRLKWLELNHLTLTNAVRSASALQIARAAAIVAADEDDKPYLITSSTQSADSAHSVVALLAQRNEFALVICVRDPDDCVACEQSLSALDAEKLFEFSRAN